jgi:hypothetical protein
MTNVFNDNARVLLGLLAQASSESSARKAPRGQTAAEPSAVRERSGNRCRGP